MKSIRDRIALLGLAGLLAGTAVVAAPGTALAHQQGFDDQYIFAATRGVDQMNAHPALKVPLFPVAFVLDAALLPFEVIAGYIHSDVDFQPGVVDFGEVEQGVGSEQAVVVT